MGAGGPAGVDVRDGSVRELDASDRPALGRAVDLRTDLLGGFEPGSAVTAASSATPPARGFSASHAIATTPPCGPSTETFPFAASLNEVPVTTGRYGTHVTV